MPTKRFRSVRCQSAELTNLAANGHVGVVEVPYCVEVWRKTGYARYQSEAWGVPHWFWRHDREAATDQSGNENARRGMDVSVTMQRDLTSWKFAPKDAEQCLFGAFEDAAVLPITYSCSARTCFVAQSSAHPGGDAIPTKLRSKPQTCRAHGKVGNEVKGQGPELHEHGDEGEREALELYHADGPSANTNSRQSTGSTWGSRPGLGRGMHAWFRSQGSG